MALQGVAIGCTCPTRCRDLHRRCRGWSRSPAAVVDNRECRGPVLAAPFGVVPPLERVALTDMSDLAFMGTIVGAGEGVGLVYATGKDAQFGRIAAGLGERAPETDFQAGLRQFSYLLLQVIALTVFILIANLMLHRPLITSALFALSIAVGITPQLLPAVVSTSLATGSRQLAQVKVLVKRLVCIEDLGDIDILVTDKTGTLTEGRISLIDTVTPSGAASDSVLRLGLLACDVDPGAAGAAANSLDGALWAHPGASSWSVMGCNGWR